MSGPIVELARAKINLALHITGRRADGYHLLDSLVTFADVADVVTVEPSHRDTLATPTVTADHELTTGKKTIRRADDAIERTLSGAVSIVKEVLRLCVIDRDDREFQDAICFHRA